MPKIKFTQNRSYRDGDKVISFVAGKVYELSDSACARWIRRNVAEEFVGKTKAAAPTVAVEPPPPPLDAPQAERDSMPMTLGQARAPITADLAASGDADADALDE